MASIRSRLIAFALKNNHLLRFRLRPEQKDWSSHAAIMQFRAECEAGARRFGKIPGDLEVWPVSIAGMSAEWIRPARSETDGVILFVHGGGYVSGSCSDHRVHVAKFVAGSGIAALQFEYRLAPEHPYPAAVDDTVAAYRWLLAQGYAADEVIFAGDSAGGGLCLATLLALRDQQISPPAAAVALSPWTDLACTGESYRTNADTCLSPAGTWTAFSRHYVGHHDPRSPWISPLYGDLHGLPPLLIYAGSDEILRDDAVRFAEKASAAGVPVTLRIGRGLFHCYPVCAPLFPEATTAMQEIDSFVRQHVGANSAQRLVQQP